MVELEVRQAKSEKWSLLPSCFFWPSVQLVHCMSPALRLNSDSSVLARSDCMLDAAFSVDAADCGAGLGISEDMVWSAAINFVA